MEKPKPKKRSKKEIKRTAKLSRRKGVAFEREVAIALRSIWPNARRHLEYQDAEANGVDLVETGAFKFQCKREKKYASITALKEIQCEEYLGDIPVLVTQGDSLPPVVVMPFDAFIRIIQSTPEAQIHTLAELRRRCGK